VVLTVPRAAGVLVANLFGSGGCWRGLRCRGDRLPVGEGLCCGNVHARTWRDRKLTHQSCLQGKCVLPVLVAEVAVAAAPKRLRAHRTSARVAWHGICKGELICQ
jgi:hypothetical protein